MTIFNAHVVEYQVQVAERANKVAEVENIKTAMKVWTAKGMEFLICSTTLNQVSRLFHKEHNKMKAFVEMLNAAEAMNQVPTREWPVWAFVKAAILRESMALLGRTPPLLPLSFWSAHGTIKKVQAHLDQMATYN